MRSNSEPASDDRYFVMGTAKKLKIPAVRDLTRSELIRLRALGESMAEKVLGPDWKNRQRKTDATYQRGRAN